MKMFSFSAFRCLPMEGPLARCLRLVEESRVLRGIDLAFLRLHCLSLHLQRSLPIKRPRHCARIRHALQYGLLQIKRTGTQ